MKVKNIVKVIAVASLMAFGATTVFAADTMSATQKQQVEGVVKDYLMKNPDVVVQSLQVYQKQQMDQARKTIESTQKAAPKFAKELFQNTKDPVAGNPNGKITIVEFFDYQCPHCIEMTPVLEAVAKTNPEVRLVFKEFPIRGPASEAASKAALAAKMQGKYFEFHKGLMAANKVLTEADIMKVAQDVGLDVAKLKTDMGSDAVSQQIKEDYKLAQSLQLLGTPAFFVAKTDVTASAPEKALVFIPGQVDQGQLEAVIKQVS